MELSRAKTVLIVAFLMLNLFLFYHLWEEEGDGVFAFGQKEEFFQLESALDAAKLDIAVSLPRGGIRIGHLVVEPWNIHRNEVVLPIWNALGVEIDLTSEALEEHSSLSEERVIISRYSTNDFKLIIRNEGIITLNSSSPRSAGGIVTLDEKEKAADAFVKSIPFVEDFELDYIQQSEDKIVFNYRQLYHDFPLYAGHLQLFMNGLNPSGFYLYRLEPVGFAEQEREIIPPYTALMRFLEVYSHGGLEKTIVDFSLGYYSQDYDAERWEIPPVWRIRLNNGELYYINAFTGYLER